MWFEKSMVLWKVFIMALFLIVMAGCSSHAHHPSTRVSLSQEEMSTSTNSLISLGLDLDAQKALNAVMREHLNAIQQIVEALGKDDFQRAQEITENQLGMAKHRDAMRRQMPRNFPPEYHDLAMAHHHAAEDLATVIPSQNLQRILPLLGRTLAACTACHRVYKR